MILQNESADDDDEHFEDVLEDAEDKVYTIPDKPIVCEVASSGEALETDDDSDLSLDEGGSATSESEDEVSDDGDDLFAAGVLNDSQESKGGPDHAGRQSLVSNDKVRSSLPGGYNPRHREPSYWY